MEKATLKIGWYVALALKPGAAPLRCYVGQIQALDSDGIRLRLINWLLGTASGPGLYVPRSEITSALVCTEEDDLETFLSDERQPSAAGQWQKAAMTGKDEKQN